MKFSQKYQGKVVVFQNVCQLLFVIRALLITISNADPLGTPTPTLLAVPYSSFAWFGLNKRKSKKQDLAKQD